MNSVFLSRVLSLVLCVAIFSASAGVVHIHHYCQQLAHNPSAMAHENCCSDNDSSDCCEEADNCCTNAISVEQLTVVGETNGHTSCVLKPHYVPHYVCAFPSLPHQAIIHYRPSKEALALMPVWRPLICVWNI